MRVHVLFYEEVRFAISFGEAVRFCVFLMKQCVIRCLIGEAVCVGVYF